MLSEELLHINVLWQFYLLDLPIGAREYDWRCPNQKATYVTSNMNKARESD
jgi:hypothetical protein